MRRIVLLFLLLLTLGCDPGYFRRFPVEQALGAISLEAALDAFETRGLPEKLYRTRPPRNLAEHFQENGYEVVRWYDRDQVPSSERGSFYYLAILADMTSHEIEIAVGAFPSLGEPPNVNEARLDLIRELCARNFVVAGGCSE